MTMSAAASVPWTMADSTSVAGFFERADGRDANRLSSSMNSSSSIAVLRSWVICEF
jgi:hypothetical protein